MDQDRVSNPFGDWVWLIHDSTHTPTHPTPTYTGRRPSAGGCRRPFRRSKWCGAPAYSSSSRRACPARLSTRGVRVRQLGSGKAKPRARSPIGPMTHQNSRLSRRDLRGGVQRRLGRLLPRRQQLLRGARAAPDDQRAALLQVRAYAVGPWLVMAAACVTLIGSAGCVWYESRT